MLYSLVLSFLRRRAAKLGGGGGVGGSDPQNHFCILSIFIGPSHFLKGLIVIWSKIEIHYRRLKPVKNGTLGSCE